MKTNKTNRSASKSFAAWQLDPSSLKTARVQFWLADGGMLGLVSLESARESVAAGRAFVVTDQAISQIVPAE
jgi:hypothetical protein